jgi:hypothetical protein
MSVSSYINEYTKSPSTTIKFNGNRSRDILSVELSSSMDNLSQATIKLLSNPGITPETKVQIKQGYNGQEVITFTGFVDTIERNNTDRGYTVQARDMLKKAMDTFLVQEVKFGVDVVQQIYYYSTYDSAEGGTFVIHQYPSLSDLNTNHPETAGNITNEGARAEAVVQWLLHMSGLAEGAEIQVDDANFFIGDIKPATFHLTSVYDAAMQIANLIGWRIFCDPTGVSRFKKRPRNPSSFYPSWTYYDKQEPYNILQLTRNESNIDLRTYVEVRGASGIRYVARGTSPYLGNTPYRGVLISDELIDTPGIATFVGNRVLSDLNRIKVTVALEADGNPIIYPGSTITMRSNICEGNYLVESHQTNMSSEGGYKSSMNAAAYFGDTAFEEPPLDITAAFTDLQVISIGDPTYMVEFDGSSSFSSVGPIVRYKWTLPDSSVQDGTESTVWYAFPDYTITGGSSANVTLQVWDGMNNTDTLSSGITLSGLANAGSIKYRHLYGALNTRAVGSVDTGATWNVQSIPAISVAASNFAISGGYTASGHALFGTTTSKIYKTTDACATIQQVFSADSSVLDINIPELDASFAAAGTSGGKVYRSTDYGETWSQIGSFAFPILQVKYSFTNFNEIAILGSGTDRLYITEDAGATWTNRPIGVNGLWMADSNVKNYVAHTAGIKNISDNTEVGIAQSFPAFTYAVNLDDAANPGAGIMTVDSNGQHYIYASGLQATQLNASNKTKHMIRDGEVPFLVYYAVASGIGKSLNSNVTMSGLYYPTGTAPASGWGYKVAYGPLASPPVPPRLIWVGQHLDVPGMPGSRAFAYLAPSGGTGGWTYIPNSENITGDVIAVTAGYIITGVNDSIDFINANDSSTSPTVFANYATVEASSSNSGASPNILSLYFSRSIGSTPPKVYAMVNSNALPTNPDLQIFNDFYNNPSSITLLEYSPPGAVTGVSPVRVMPRNKNKALVATTPNIFASTSSWLLYDADGLSIAGVVGPVGLWSPAYYTGLTTDHYAIASKDSTYYYFIDAAGASASITSIPAYVGITSIYESAILGSDIYYADQSATSAQGIYRVSSYGLGSSTKLLDVPTSEGVLRSFTVTHDANESKDYMVVVIDIAGVGAEVKYSVDAGANWLDAPNLPGAGVVGLTQYCWFVDTR